MRPNCFGDRDRREFPNLLRDSGCIARLLQRIIVQRSGEINRPQFGVVESVVTLIALDASWRAAFVTKV